MSEEGDHHKVHFNEESEEHTNEIRIEYRDDGDKQGIVVSLGFLQIFHKYEIIIDLPREKIPDTGNLVQKHTEPPNINCRLVQFEDKDDKTVGIHLHFFAHKDKICQETIVLTDGAKNVPLNVKAKVLGKGKGTGALRNGIKCIEILKDPNESENDTDWDGF